MRLIVTNGGGRAQADAAFTTEAVMPTEAALAFAAPRTDTSARINAYVNPEGEAPLTYQFAYSTDGTTWISLKATRLRSSRPANKSLLPTSLLASLRTPLTSTASSWSKMGLAKFRRDPSILS